MDQFEISRRGSVRRPWWRGAWGTRSDLISTAASARWWRMADSTSVQQNFVTASPQTGRDVYRPPRTR